MKLRRAMSGYAGRRRAGPSSRALVGSALRNSEEIRHGIFVALGPHRADWISPSYVDTGEAEQFSAAFKAEAVELARPGDRASPERREGMLTLRQVCGTRMAAKASRVAAAVAFGALGLCRFCTSNAFAQSGWVLQYTGQLEPPGVRTPEVPACYGGTYCQFWEELDRNAGTARIVVAGGQVYQLQYGGAIFQYPSTPCTSQCPGWWLIDFDPTTKAIFSDGTSLYKLLQDGRLFRWTGSSWAMVPYNDEPRYVGAYVEDGTWVTWLGGEILTVAFGGGITAVVQQNRLSLRWADGYTEYNRTRPRSVAVTGSGVVYEFSPGFLLDPAGCCNEEWRSGFITARWLIPALDPPYQKFTEKIIFHPQSEIVAIAAASNWLFTLQNDGSIWRYTATTPWTGASPGIWEKLDNNPATARIVASGSELYQLHQNGSLWRFTGPVCNGSSCPGWELLIGGGVGRIAIDGQSVYALTQPQPLVRPLVIRPSPFEYVCPECL